ncbi:MAG: hypothetical protein K5784_04720 [Clostridiales bacterium]|nr:hypothetical protein [Clostridiales bacterium]
MTESRDRFRAALSGDLKSIDRLPVIEWASWWHLTLNRWAEEGLKADMSAEERFQALGLDPHRQLWFRHTSPACPKPPAQGKGLMKDRESYLKLKPYLYPPEEIRRVKQIMEDWKTDQSRNIIWFSMDGGFWFPRTLFGIEAHLYSFYDEPELYHEILEDLAEYQLKVMDAIYSVCTPVFMTIAEDMSYNKGPMLSKGMFTEFLKPYYGMVVPYIRSKGTRVIVDSDGDITEMIPWLMDAGIEGALPLERQAGVDVNRLRQEFGDFILIGGYDKMVMKYGEAAMRQEFERILPAMKKGKYIPSVDHQTPPDVSLENYRIYIKLLKEYCAKAVS